MRFDGLRRERALASKQYRDGHFHNTAPISAGLQSGTQGGVIKEFLFGGKKRKPPGAIPVDNPLSAWATPVQSGFRATWLGHSTVLLEVDGLRVLTDPVFGYRLGPVSFAGPKRFHAAPVSIEQLPQLDAVLVSHDHYDHLCKPTIIELAKRDVPFVTSLGVGVHLEKFGVKPENIHELDWWESFSVNADLKLTATPSQHFSGRLGSGRDTTLWSSWVIESPTQRIFFSGDTGLTDEFFDIKNKFGSFDLTMLEVGAWHPAWGRIHLGPANALKAFEMLGGGTLLPVHWCTFDLGLHPWADPAEQLLALANQSGARILTPQIGRPFEPSHLDGPVPWWRDVTTAVQTEGRLAAAE
ncbi:MAG TPA: MBL fold metallo-hydrolase [Kofleriaceae bacterium]|jgi:L-ascorbate metabolism protein UlaG (beta-lactamase superfamily)